MARILSQREWFDQIASTAMYETEFESIITTYADVLYPEYYVVPFKATVSAEDSTAKADLALIEKNYRQWWVGEVEMGHHSLESHVLPQVRTLSRAVYGEEEALRLSAKCPALNSARLLDMMKGTQPRVLVIVNTPRPAWAPVLRRYDALLAVFEIFRSQKNEFLFRLNGEQPASMPDLLSTCSFDPLLPRFLIVNSPGALNAAPRSKISIFYDNQITVWERIDSADKVWLSPVGPNPLSPSMKYEILRRATGEMTFRESAK
jgi:hypothetical protein